MSISILASSIASDLDFSERNHPSAINQGDWKDSDECDKNYFFASDTNKVLEEGLRKVVEYFKTDVSDLCMYLSSSNPKFFSNLNNSKIEKRIPINNIFVNTSRKYSRIALPSKAYIGVTIYSSNGLEFAAINTFNMSSCFYVFKKGTLYKIVRQSKRDSLKLLKVKTPVIDEFLLKDVKSNTIDFISNHRIYVDFGVDPKKGVLFSGPPGNGKSMLSAFIAEKLIKKQKKVVILSNKNIVSDDIPLYLSTYDCVIFDDIDINFLSRSGSGASIACMLLSALDGPIKTDKPSLRIFTTNESLETIDVAFLRKGRIDKTYTIDMPSKTLRKKLFLTWNKTIAENIDIDKLVELTQGWSFAKLESVKTKLVMNFIDEEKWDLDTAFEQINSDGIKYKEPVGFSLNMEEV
jgi:hypothetical protein